MTETRDPAPPPSPAVTTLEPGVRAARLRAGLTQLEVADRLNVALDTYRRWDRGTARPRSPQRQQHLAVVLETPLDVLFPIEEDPHVAVALRQYEPQVAGSASAGSDHEEVPHADRSVGPGDPGLASAPECGEPSQGEELRDDGDAWRLASRDDAFDSQPPREPGVPALLQAVVVPQAGSAAAMPSPREILRTVDDGAWFRPVRLRLGADRRLATVAGLAAVLVVVLWLAPGITPGGRGDHTPASTPVDLAAGLRSALTATIDATLASAANSEQRARRGADRLVRRASGAAERGELELALARLDRVRCTYGMTPAAVKVRRRVSVIRERRAERAVAQRAEAKKRAVAAARRQPPSSSGGAAVSSAPNTGSASATSGSTQADSGTATTNSGATGQTSQATQSPKPSKSEPARDPGLF